MEELNNGTTEQPEPPKDVEFAPCKPSHEMGRTDKRTGQHVKKMAKAMQKMGLIGISEMRLAAFRQLGIELDPASLVRDGRAGAMVAQQAVLDTLLDVRRMYEKASDKGKVRLVPHLGFLARCLTAANKGITDSAGEIAKVPNVPQVNTVVHTMVPVQIVNEVVEKVEKSEVRGQRSEIREADPAG